MSLLQELSEKDRSIMTNYIGRYGAGSAFIGLDEWLKYWDHSKVRLYKLLGNKLIYKVPFSYDKNEEILEYEIKEHLLVLPFKRIYHWFYTDFIKEWQENKKINKDTMLAFSAITDWNNFIDDKITKGIKFKKENSRKMLQIQKGMKPIRALQRIIEYFPDEFQAVVKNHHFAEKEDTSANYYKKAFENFRLAHSMILNDKKVEGQLCISIHPMDFMTMSDNASDWSSCMSWIEDGCYRIGSVEMMNSNNVLCCYLEGSKPFTFEYNTEICEWNNKRWRTLVYFTNDIIMGGKAYPYVNDAMTKELISIIRQLAEKNLNRHYSFGPEPYKDMIHINTIEDIQQNYEWVYNKDDFKHSIIWDTKGMYNDMFNDNRTTYWCYRNKVKHKKIYNVSGKAPCLCCGDYVIDFDEDETYDYNDRYSNVGSLICYSCEKERTCACCGKVFFDEPLYPVNDNKLYCKKCFIENIKRCPQCGKLINIYPMYSHAYYKNKKASFKKPAVYSIGNIIDIQKDIEKGTTNLDIFEGHFEPFLYCYKEECKKAIEEKYAYTRNYLDRAWRNDNEGYKVFYPNEELEKFLYRNLEAGEPGTDEEILG